MVAAVLVLLVVQSILGVLALLRWRRARRAGTAFPTALVATHVVVVVVATALWVVRIVTDDAGWAWAALAVVLIGNGIGDLVLAGRWRLDAAVGGRWLRGWVAAAKGLLTPRRRIGALHAAGAGLTTAAMLVACVAG